MDPFKRLQPQDYAEKFRAWREVVDTMHANSTFTGNPAPAWTPLTKPIAQSRVALLTTAGAHLRSQPPFDLDNEHGDWSHREIPGDTDLADLAVSHGHYDTTDANTDPNIVLPLAALRTLVAVGEVGAVAPVHVGMMGWIPDGRPVVEQTAPAVARLLTESGADVAVLTPG